MFVCVCVGVVWSLIRMNPTHGHYNKILNDEEKKRERWYENDFCVERFESTMNENKKQKKRGGKRAKKEKRKAKQNRFFITF